MSILTFCAVGLVIRVACVSAAVEPEYQTSFARDAWNPDEWIMVKSPRWSHFGKWVQGESYIENETPKGATEKEMLGAKAEKTYTSMVLATKFSGSTTIQSTMEFTDRMAPLIVIAPELGKDANGTPEYREHFEIVLFDRGANIWHHYFKDGKPSWKLAAYARFKLKPDTKYDLEVKCSHKGTDKRISVSVDGFEFGYKDDSLPDTYYVGITGCEGINRFYNFSLSR